MASPAASGLPTSPALRVASPKVLSRADWKAGAPLAVMRPHVLERITVHHSGVVAAPEEDLPATMRSLQRYSQGAKHWPDVPYHFVIDMQGRVAEGRSLAFAGDTNTKYDPAGHLLICLEGNFEVQTPTETQIASLKALCRWLCQRYHLPATRIYGHNHYASTACPGHNLSKHLSTLRMLK